MTEIREIELRRHTKYTYQASQSAYKSNAFYTQETFEGVDHAYIHDSPYTAIYIVSLRKHNWQLSFATNDNVECYSTINRHIVYIPEENKLLTRSTSETCTNQFAFIRQIC